MCKGKRCLLSILKIQLIIPSNDDIDGDRESSTPPPPIRTTTLIMHEACVFK